MTFNQCRLQDALGWTTVKWIPTGMVREGRHLTFRGWKCTIKVVYWPALPEEVFAAQVQK